MTPADVAPDRCHIEGKSATKTEADNCFDTLWRRYVQPLGTYSWAFTEREPGARWKAAFWPDNDDSLPVLCIWLGAQAQELVPLNAAPYMSTSKFPC
jgi:hypothetical protein